MVKISVLCVFGFAVLAAHASDPTQTCYDMYPVDSYESSERYNLIQECMQAYSGHNTYDSYENNSDSGYYDGTVEDYVHELPAEEPVSMD